MAYRKKSGFTLIELIVVMTIIGILSSIAMIYYIGTNERARSAVDQQNLRIINNVTQVYLMDAPESNPFTLGSSNDSERMQTLVDEGQLESLIEAQQRDVSFTWNLTLVEWILSTSTVLTGSDVVLGSGWQNGFITNYNGTYQDIIIPNSINSTTVTQVYQDAFYNKGLKSVNFEHSTDLTRIHARAFKDNSITELKLPPNLTRIDYGAFLNNPIKKVTIGSDVVMEGNVIGGNNTFKDAYIASGAGTYELKNGNWVKID